MVQQYIQIALSLLISVMLMLCGHLMLSGSSHGRHRRLLLLILLMLTGQLTIMLLTFWSVIEPWSFVRPLIGILIPPLLYLFFSRGLEQLSLRLMSYIMVALSFWFIYTTDEGKYLDFYIASIECIFGALLISIYFRPSLSVGISMSQQKASVVAGIVLLVLAALDVVISIQIESGQDLQQSWTLAIGITIVLAMVLGLASGVKRSSSWLEELLMEGQSSIFNLVGQSNLDGQRQQQLAEQLTLLCCENHVYLDEQVSLNFVAQKLNCTPRELSNLVNQVYKKGFLAFINDYKVKHAVSLIESGGYGVNITSVMYDSGFRTKSSFNKEFKTRMGCSPSDFRKGLGDP